MKEWCSTEEFTNVMLVCGPLERRSRVQTKKSVCAYKYVSLLCHSLFKKFYESRVGWDLTSPSTNQSQEAENSKYIPTWPPIQNTVFFQLLRFCVKIKDSIPRKKVHTKEETINALFQK